MKEFDLIVCLNKTGGIGYKKDIPWRCTKDLQYFKNKTENCNIIMGRNTWESLGCKPLPDRNNIVISSDPKNSHSLIEAINSINNNDKIFIIGGSKLYEAAINNPYCKHLYINVLNIDTEADVFFPLIPNWFRIIKNSKNNWLVKYNKNFEQVSEKVLINIYKYKNTNFSEVQYINSLRKIHNFGRIINGRNGICYSNFGSLNFKYNLDQGFPLFTHRKIFFRGIVEELLFFLNGESNTKKLEEKGINIWKDNTSKDFLKSKNLPYNEGDMGPMYGWNWRHFGDKYICSDNQYSGFDQLKNLGEKIQNCLDTRISRRDLLLTTYDPSTVDQCVLPPCHGLIVQFDIEIQNNGNNILNCKMYQRSADMILGYPFNVASYSLLVLILCKYYNLFPGKLYISLGNAHIYQEHLENMKEIFKKEIYQYPEVSINSEIKNYSFIEWLEQLRYENFNLKNYKFNKPIKFQMIP